MENKRKMIIVIALTVALGSVFGAYAMDGQEEEHKDESAQAAAAVSRVEGATTFWDTGLEEIRVADEQRVERNKRLLCTAIAALRDNVDVNALWRHGYTLLYFAARKGHVDFAEMLLERDADVNAVNKYDNTALHIAARKGHSEIVKMLLKRNACVNVVNADGDAPLHMAVVGGYSEVVEMLLEHNADVNAVDGEDDLPLHIAVWCDHTIIVGILLEHNADVNAVDRDSCDSLFFATQKGDIATVEMLLKKNADVNAVNNHGYTALLSAVIRGYDKIVEMLIFAGADPNFATKGGRVAFNFATSEIVQVMVDARAARAKMEKPARLAQRDVPDLSVMLALAANRQGQWMVPWLLRVDPRAQANGGVCGICATSFVERVINDGVELHRATQACPHLVCDECEELQCKAQAAPDTDRNRGIYLGQNADGVDQWFLPGRINLNRCPECRAEQDGPEFVPTVAQQAQFNALKEEFKELELARRLSCMLKQTNVLRRFIPEAGVIDLVEDYAAVAPAVAIDQN